MKRNVSLKERQRRAEQLTRYNKTREYSDATRKKMSGHRKGFIYCYDENGNYLKVTKEEFKKNPKLMGVASKKAKSRKFEHDVLKEW